MTIYDSWNPQYKTPFGAVEKGTVVDFALYPPRVWNLSGLFLCIWDETADIYHELPMHWAGSDQVTEIYRVELNTKDLWGLVWYHFRFERPNGMNGYIGRSGERGLCAVQRKPVNYQLTVYTLDENVPEWYGRGVTYHIFPDRFCRSKIPDATGLIGKRRVHENWGDTPDYLPSENGEIRNNDFFGGNIAGVREKLPYIKSLGVSTIYFSPIFESASNHRYDTADYRRLDPMFGTEREFKALCSEARELGIRVILDGVFNHTGFDSRYFNGRGSYAEPGAYQNPASRYASWFFFHKWPDKYESWWGFYTLPKLNISDPACEDFLVGKADSVIRHWLRAGASGWRLDVADELTDDFIRKLRQTAIEENPEAVIIGEVWEDASNKISYNKRRHYVMGGALDSVMNYPLRNAILAYLLGGSAEQFRDTMETLRENYPRPLFYNLMNALGTHDTPRILTVLGAEQPEYDLPREGRAVKTLSDTQRALAVKRLKFGAAILFCFPGSPTVYYGDEAGMQGFEDPFNRRGYPWGLEDQELLSWYRELGQLRSRSEALQKGELRYLRAEGSLLVLERSYLSETVVLRCDRDTLTVEIQHEQ